MTQEIVTVGAPVLRQQARPLSRQEILSPAIQALIEQMRETMHAAPGVGLAAPQIDLPLQLAVIEDRAEYLKDVPAEILKERDRRPVRFHVIINPVLTADPEQIEFFEGCLSFPGWVGLVPRARRVRVECLDHRGEPHTLDAVGWHARILQHEIDHLNGRLYIDRMHTRSLTSTDHYAKFWKDLPVAELKERLKIG